MQRFLQATDEHQDDNHHIDSHSPSISPQNYTESPTLVDAVPFEDAEEEHIFDAFAAVYLTITLIGCLLFAYYVKQYRIYYLPESAGTLLVGIAVGGVARLYTSHLKLFEFSPEVFFFILLPPIIFEAGYSLKRKHFFENFGAITMYAMLGTILSTFLVGLLCFYSAKMGLVRDIDQENPMEALIFGALISAVDPVATLSIMGNPELQCDQLLYSLVFGESVLNDAVAIVLFKTFLAYYKPDGPDWRDAGIPSALLSFLSMTLLSILVGVVLGLVASFIYRHSSLSDYPKLETSLLFCFCYLCYSTAEAIGLSGIMALFFNGIVMSHYNSYNLSEEALVASESIFATLATVTETIVFLYMGMGVFTGRFQNWDVLFSCLALLFCLLGRAINIFPLSWLANRCRRQENQIPMKMQCVLWFAGLRGAIAFALSENMPGPYKDTYATATLFICIFTTVVCGSFTERILSHFGMKQNSTNEHHLNGGSALYSSTNAEEDVDEDDDATFDHLISNYPNAQKTYEGVKGMWQSFDDNYLKIYFGGSPGIDIAVDDNHHHNGLGNFELSLPQERSKIDEDYDNINESGNCERIEQQLRLSPSRNSP
mmetsp:Transcript_12854/g.19951  ORF Transcript_12854/g.19951 Transcript_12854/m.19951 type:complete len:599 (+) Transcript_12854:125-1921(+)|eukprot:CAMPEP_0195309620 /NCGR_PEP_ID=MMETSP0707-20130614/38827_1 /TAXON_ID=33640 /ORGANISM="Asterionellopsis glacialis, Strain CCMP134" /LENGTH=598 /DNA_ID=CAMNT_0040373917 /DNA_START=97 /DNA_END=1893 /DNA_ORIENTATION=+